VHLGKKIGRASTNAFSEDALQTVVRDATEIASHQADSPDFLPMPGRQTYQKVENFDEKTAFFSPEERAEAIRESVEECRKSSLTATGSFSSGYAARGVANSKGVFAFHTSSAAHFNITVSAGSASGWAEQISSRVSEIAARDLVRTAVEKARLGKDPVDLEPGRYTVIFEPAAAAEFLLFMSYYTFGALPVIEGRSFLSGKLGEKVLGENINIVDDAYHPLFRGLPFDYEGMPRKKVVLIEKGVAKGLVQDRKTALAMNTESTGHSLPQPNAYGPIPENLLLDAGESSLDEMIASTGRGILVTQLHYCNVEDPKHMVLTGLTRNGTFLIEDGKLTRGVRNFRFTESAVNAFNRVEKASREKKLVGAFFGGEFAVPALKVREFAFTSKAEL
jgi:PmbA protein